MIIGQIFKADDGTELRIESIDELWRPFDDPDLDQRAQIVVTIKEPLNTPSTKL